MKKVYQYILGDNLILDVEVYETAFVPARTYGPPEDCYPAEGGEVEIQGVTVNGEEFEIEGIYLSDSDGGYVALEDAIVTAIMEGDCNE